MPHNLSQSGTVVRRRLVAGDEPASSRERTRRGGAGRWREAASSKVYRIEGRRYVLDTANSRLLEQVGMVSGAVWSDLDGDGFPELVLACEWGPLRIFKNARGKLLPWDARVTI